MNLNGNNNISNIISYIRNRSIGNVVVAILAIVLSACSVSYKFNGASIDYTKTKTIQIADFPIRSSYVWGPMASIFNNQLKDVFANHTRLSQVKRNGDLKVEGEITQYTQRNKAVTAQGESAQVELSMTVNVRFTNNVNHSEDFERQFTATTTYDSRTGGMCDADGEGHHRPDLQCHRGKLVIPEHQQNVIT